MEAFINWFEDASLYLQDFNAVTVIVRILLAGLAGGIIGFDREIHGRAAGLRTHSLVAIGAALSALIGVCLAEQMAAQFGVASDAQRTGAQVISGIGFLCAGTILVKKGNSHISGLTTAAGLWATAAIGLAVGYGLYLAGFTAVLLVVVAFTLVSRIEFSLIHRRQRIFVYLELDSIVAVKEVILILREQYSGTEIQVTPARSNTAGNVGIEALIRIHSKEVTVEEKIETLQQLGHVVFALPIS